MLSLWRLPEVLIIGLKRFEFHGPASAGRMAQIFARSGSRQKLNHLVMFPLEGLDLAPFVLRSDGLRGESYIYDLFAVINHYGLMGYGHYTAMAREWSSCGEPGNWYSFDDEQVNPCSESEVVSAAAYVLLYRRRPIP